MDSALLAMTVTANVVEASVARVHDDGRVIVRGHANAADDAPIIECELLQVAGGAPLALAPRDRVLVWRADPAAERGVILGRIGGTHALGAIAAPVGTTSAPDGASSAADVVLEAERSLTLRCGEASLTLRADGRVLLRGEDVVSHAKRVNRIRGGSVAVN